MMHKQSQAGFSLIELIVSLGVFSVVVTTAVGALLMLVAANDQLQGEQSIMTNLSFALDSMTREIRTGTSFFCDERNSYNAAPSTNIFRNGNDLDAIINDDFPTPYQDCDGGGNGAQRLHGVAFIEGGDSVSGVSERILYFHDAGAGQLFRRVGTGDRVSIVSSDIYIQDADFIVTGSTPQLAGGGNHYDQASVTIYLIASASSTTPADEWYHVQTTVTQRTLDI